MAGKRKSMKGKEASIDKRTGSQTARNLKVSTGSKTQSQAEKSSRKVRTSASQWPTGIGQARQKHAELGENIDDVSSSSEEDKISAPSRKRVRVDEQLLSEDCNEDSNNEMEMISNEGLFQKRIALQDTNSMPFGPRPKIRQNKSFASSPGLPTQRISGELTDNSRRPYDSSPPPDFRRRRSQSLDDQEEDATGDDKEEIRQAMWIGLARRPTGESSEGHKPVFNLVKTLLLARIFSGQGDNNRRCSPFVDQDFMQLDTLMRKCWTYIRSRKEKRMYDLDAGLHVDEVPTRREAKKMHDSIGVFRSHVMERVRNLVETHYCFGDPKDHRERVTALLLKDSFTVEDDAGIKRPKRFVAPVIIKAIAKCFFHVGSKESLGRLEHTSNAFCPLRGETVVFIAVCIGFALKEYETGKRVPAKFEGPQVKTLHSRIQRTWDDQDLERQQVVLALLNKRVKNQAGFEDGQIEEMFEAVPDPYKDSFEDLEDCLDELSPAMQAIVRRRMEKSQMDSGYGSSPCGVGEPISGGRSTPLGFQSKIKTGPAHANSLNQHTGPPSCASDVGPSSSAGMAAQSPSDGFAAALSSLSSAAAPSSSAGLTLRNNGGGDAEGAKAEWILQWDGDEEPCEQQMAFDITWTDFCMLWKRDPENARLWYGMEGQSEKILYHEDEFDRMISAVRLSSSKIVKVRYESNDEFESP